MRRAQLPAILAVTAFLLVGTSTTAAARSPISRDIDTYAHKTLKISSYKLAAVDLNADGRREFVLYASDRNWCGSGGCTLFIVSPTRSGYRLVSRISIANLPVRLLATTHRGWRDLAVTVRGGGILKTYEARLPFDGERYAENPSVPPASRVKGPPGTMLISAKP